MSKGASFSLVQLHGGHADVKNRPVDGLSNKIFEVAEGSLSEFKTGTVFFFKFFDTG